MKSSLIIILTLLSVFLVACAQQGQVFVPTDIIPVEEEPEEPTAPPVSGEVVSEVPTSQEPEVPAEIPTEVPVEQEIPETPAPETPQEVDDNVPVVEVVEGERVELNLRATDPDGDPVTYTFSPPLDDTGNWQTGPGDAGEYLTKIVASDGTTEAEQDVLIRVSSSNRPPVLQITRTVTVEEGGLIELEATVTDPDGDDVDVSYSGFMTSATYRTSSNDQGEHTVTVTATDGVNTVSADVAIVVEDVNRAPIIASINDITVQEGELVSVNVLAADPDKDEVSLTFSPPLDDEGQWLTSLGDAGVFEITITASDGLLSAERKFTLTVESSNRPPRITGLPTVIEVDETETVELDPDVSDPDGDEVQVSYSGFMTRSRYTTTYNDGNNNPSEYTVTVTATDGVNTVTEDVQIRVFNKNRPPVFTI